MPLNMPKPTKAPSGDFAPAPEGSQASVLIGVYELGHQWKTGQYGTGWQPKVWLSFELSDSEMSDGRPFVIGREFTLSLNEKSSLYGFLSRWLGAAALADGIDLAGLLGRPGTAAISHRKGEGKWEGRVFADLDSVTPFPATFRGKPVDPPTPSNDLVAYEIEMGLPPESIPEFLRKKILASREIAGEAAHGGPAPTTPPVTRASGPTPNADGAEDDVPFDPAKY
jgi:hypothetical protein